MCYRLFNFISLIILLLGCAVIPQDMKAPHPYPNPPPERDLKIQDYYSYNRAQPFLDFKETVVKARSKYVHKKEEINTEYGIIKIDYYQRNKANNNLIFIFPVLGGKNYIESYFARYFANYGYDTAIVHRDKDFKNPEMFDHLEEIFRKNVIRDRIAMDFFERIFHKKNFGSFGISRGAINAAITAGIDSRLKYNIFALGGSHLVDIFRDSEVPGIKKYKKRVEEFKHINDQEFYDLLAKDIYTDPKNFAKYIDPKNTLMFLSFFDNAVPYKYGLKLRKELGTPKTVFLASGHYTALLYSQFIKILLPIDGCCIFPFDFIENTSLEFYNESFGIKKIYIWQVPFHILQLPFNILGNIYYALI